MSKYSKFRHERPKPPREEHPVWRGIGCLLMVIIPVMSYAIAVELVNYGLQKNWPFPPAFVGHIQFPQWAWNTTIISRLITPIANFNNLGAVALVTVALIIVLGGIFSTIYAAVYRAVGPSRYTQMDAPPGKYRPKHYKR